MKQIRKLLSLFLIGGVLYLTIELLWRGYSHWTMFLVGGFCFILLGLINEIFTFSMPLYLQMLAGMDVITLVELLSGYIINVKLGWNVWDYSDMPLNFFGQICVPYMGLWFFLSAIGIILDDYLRYWLFDEQEPHYTLFRWG